MQNIFSRFCATLIMLPICTVLAFQIHTSQAFAATSMGERTIVDMSGDTVTIKGEVKKIINLWPSATSSFFALGAGDLIAAQAVSSTHSGWTKLFYPNAMNIPALGSINPTIEDIINHQPDLVIIHPSSAASGFAQKIRDVGIPAININFNNYDSMVQAYTILGEVLGGKYQEKLNTWCKAVTDKINHVESLTKDIPAENKPIVYYIAGQSNSLNTTMPIESIVNDWVSIAGGRFASVLMNLTSTEATAEGIFALNPDIIISAGIYQHLLKDEVENTNGWKDLKAVTTNKVYTNPYACFNWERFGLESQLQINYSFMLIQPELAAQNGIDKQSMLNEVIAFYKTYTDYELTMQQAEYMLAGLSPEGKVENPVK